MSRRTLFVLLFLLGDAAHLLAAASDVAVSGRQLIVRKRLGDGSLGPPAPYVIRGVVWSPASTNTNTYPGDPNNANVRRPEFSTWASTDVPLLAAMHVNTVRLLLDPGTDAGGTAVLDQLYANGIMAIVTVDDAVNDLGRVTNAVNFYKNHPAVLMWMLGNEWNINRYYGVASSVADAAQRTQTAAALIKSLDPAHPVAASYGDVDIDAPGMHLADTQHYVNDVCTSVDIWALNIYRGNSFGTLFTQWASISAKPMLIGEFGTDAFRSAGSTSAGTLDATMQSDWDLPLWDEIFINLSANVPEAAALGGTAFEFNDEWWKVSPNGSQQSGGYAGAHPDGFANEEYFGLFTIARQPRAVVSALTAAFDPAYTPLRTHSYRSISRGYLAEEYGSQYGTAWIFEDGAKLYSKNGGGGGGRGFNVAVFDPATNALQQPVAHFDTWSASHSGTGDFCSMNTFLDGIPNGMLVVIGVADEAGLNSFPPSSCQFLNTSCLSGTLQRLAALGSTQLSSYCYGSSWAFAAVKGEGVARAEAVGSAIEVQARTTLPFVTRTLSTTVTGNGEIHAVPAGVSCGAGCTTFQLGATVALHAVPSSSNWAFSSWSGDCAGPTTPCNVSMSSNRSVGATFVAVPPPTPSGLDARYDGTAAVITWSAVANAASYEVARSADGQNYTTVATPSANSAADATVAGGTAYLYRVRAKNSDGAPSGWSSVDLMTAISFTDDPLVAGTTRIRVSHLTELRDAVNAVRTLAGMMQTTFTDPAPAGVRIRALHLTELRQALAPARSALGLPSLAFTNDPLQANVSRLKAIDFSELREAVR